jgi:hypothetical protein
MNYDKSRSAIKGRVLRNGRPVVDASVSIADGPSHPDIAALTGANGEYAFNDLEPGDYAVQAYIEGDRPAVKRCSVPAGQTAILDFS